jgi:hypothetical protein
VLPIVVRQIPGALGHAGGLQRSADVASTKVAVVVAPASKRSDLLEARLTASALQARNADDEALGRYWEEQERERVARLVKAGRQLGFELPWRCY